MLRPDRAIVAANDAYLKASGVRNLSTSLGRVLATTQPDTMPVQHYAIRRPPAAGGGFELRRWSLINLPVLDDRRGVEG